MRFGAVSMRVRRRHRNRTQPEAPTMDQHSAIAGSTLLRAALRVLLLLGGALVWWLLAANAPATATSMRTVSVAKKVIGPSSSTWRVTTTW